MLRAAHCCRSPEVAVLVTLRMMRTGLCPDQLEDQIGFASSTCRLKVEKVMSTALEKLSRCHLKEFDPERVKKALTVNGTRGFPGAIGSADCFSVKRWCGKEQQGGARTGGKDGVTVAGVQVVA